MHDSVRCKERIYFSLMSADMKLLVHFYLQNFITFRTDKKVQLTLHISFHKYDPRSKLSHLRFLMFYAFIVISENELLNK